MQTGAAVKTADQAFARFENQEKGGTQMETVAQVAEATGLTEEQVREDLELARFRSEVERELPPARGVVGEAEARADYLLERLAREHALMERTRGAAKLRIEMIKANEAEELRKIENRCGWLEAKIRTHMPGDGARFKAVYGKKSVAMASGEVGFRLHPASVEITDPQKALAYAKANGLEVKVTETVNRTPLKEHVIRDLDRCEPIPETDGFKFVPARDEFYCSPKMPF